MLSSVEHLGNVDIAIELEPKISEDADSRGRCEARRLLATRRGRHSRSMIDSLLWPRTEIFRAHRARARALSLHEWNQVVRIPRVRYRVLFGDRERIVQMISEGECVDGAECSGQCRVVRASVA